MYKNLKTQRGSENVSIHIHILLMTEKIIPVPRAKCERNVCGMALGGSPQCALL
jgi:hypothetical protein